MRMARQSCDETEILLLGDPRLRRRSREIEFPDESVLRAGRLLSAALERFRARHGFGRALAAPQIGLDLRMIAMNLGRGPFLIINPRLENLSPQRFTMWDDCMSFPGLMVRVERHMSLDLAWQDEKGTGQRWQSVAQDISELLQHEVDHLDGVLAVDRALGRDALVAREVYERNRDAFGRQVDYTIAPARP